MTLHETLLAATLAWFLALAPRSIWQRWSVAHTLAGAAILFPAVESLIGFIDLAPLLGEYTVLRPYTVEQLDRMPLRILRRNLLIPIAGVLLAGLIGGRRLILDHARAVDKPAPAWIEDGRLGLALAPVLIVSQLGLLFLLQGPLEVLATGDESALFANATWLHVVGLSLAPALAEELYYRGLLQGLVEQASPWQARAWVAIAVQGVIFGVAHAGFTTVSHLLGPLAFGLAMGYLRSVVGIGACIVLHASINLAFFSVDPGAGSLGLQITTLVLSLVGLVVLIREGRRLVRVLLSGPEPIVSNPEQPSPEVSSGPSRADP